MAKLTQEGYQLQTQNAWFDSERQLYIAIDPLWNLDPSTPDGLKLAHDAEVFGALDELIQQAYNSKDPNKARNIDLDILSALTGTMRSDGSPSSVDVTLKGVFAPNTLVPRGTTLESATTGTRWTTDQDCTIVDAMGVTVGATCTVSGQIQADAGTITRIIDVVGGLASVNNAMPAVIGTTDELDSSLRVKRATAVGRPGNNQVDSTLGELFAVDDVRRVKAYENDTNSASVSVDNPFGIPAHSMAYIVDGGTNEAVAMAIYLKKNPGVLLYQAGTPVSVIVTSPKYPTNTKNIRFSRPIYVDITVAVTVADDGTLPSNIESLIQNAFIDFAAGGLVPAEFGFKVQGFDIGEDVPFFTLTTPINKVLGQYGNAHIQSMTVNGASVDVAIAYNQLSRWTSSNITVTVV